MFPGQEKQPRAGYIKLKDHAMVRNALAKIMVKVKSKKLGKRVLYLLSV